MTSSTNFGLTLRTLALFHGSTAFTDCINMTIWALEPVTSSKVKFFHDHFSEGSTSVIDAVPMDLHELFELIKFYLFNMKSFREERLLSIDQCLRELLDVESSWAFMTCTDLNVTAEHLLDLFDGSDSVRMQDWLCNLRKNWLKLLHDFEQMSHATLLLGIIFDLNKKLVDKVEFTCVSRNLLTMLVSWKFRMMFANIFHVAKKVFYLIWLKHLNCQIVGDRVQSLIDCIDNLRFTYLFFRQLFELIELLLLYSIDFWCHRFELILKSLAVSNDCMALRALLVVDLILCFKFNLKIVS